MKRVCRFSFPAFALVSTLLTATTSSLAGSASLTETSEQLIARCRKLATSGQRPEAIRELQQYLSTNENGDAQVLLGQALSWEGKYEEARKELQKVLAKHKDHGDALPALINVELWSGHPDAAAVLVNDALKRQPQNTSLMLARVRVLRSLGDYQQARDVVAHLLQVDPGNSDGLQLREQLFEEGRKLESGISHSVEWFNDGTAPWHETQFAFKQESTRGSVIARFSQTEKFSMTSRQSELEFYPHIRPGTYMYLGAGYSNDRRLYPRFRGGAELFQSVGHGWELSGGMRTMAFSDQVNIYTASVGKYRGNWYYSVRTFVTPGDSGLSRSFQFQARRYFGSSGTDYLGFRLGGGTSPAEIRSIADIAILNQFSSGFETYRRISRIMTLSGRLGLSREDRLYRSELMHYYADLGMQFRF